MKRLLPLVVSLALSAVACAAAPPAEEEASHASALGGYSRQGVYDAVHAHARAANDLRRADYTDQRLVSAIGWLADHAPAFTISAIRSDHPTRDSTNAHAGGFSADMYAQNGSSMRAFLQAVNEDPYVYEVGLGGAYKSYASAITNKAYFMDNGQTHVHIGVIHAYGTCHSGHCGTSAGDDPDDDASDADDTSGDEAPTAVTCASATLGRNVPAGTCVQRDDDGAWYVCAADAPTAWPMVDSPDDPRCTSCPQLDDGSCR